MAVGGYALMTSVGGAAGQADAGQGHHGLRRATAGARTKSWPRCAGRSKDRLRLDQGARHRLAVAPAARARWSPSRKEELRLICDLAHDFGVQVMQATAAARTRSRSLPNAASPDRPCHADGRLRTGRAGQTQRCNIMPALTFQANPDGFGDAIHASPTLQGIFRKEIGTAPRCWPGAFRAGVPVLTGSERLLGHALRDWHYREMGCSSNTSASRRWRRSAAPRRTARLPCV